MYVLFTNRLWHMTYESIDFLQTCRLLVRSGAVEVGVGVLTEMWGY